MSLILYINIQNYKKKVIDTNNCQLLLNFQQEIIKKGREIITTLRADIMLRINYIMPPIPGAAAAGGSSSFFSAITHSVVKNMPAIDAAFSRATRVTLAGSMTPV